MSPSYKQVGPPSALDPSTLPVLRVLLLYTEAFAKRLKVGSACNFNLAISWLEFCSFLLCASPSQNSKHILRLNVCQITSNGILITYVANNLLI